MLRALRLASPAVHALLPDALGARVTETHVPDGLGGVAVDAWLALDLRELAQLLRDRPRIAVRADGDALTLFAYPQE